MLTTLPWSKICRISVLYLGFVLFAWAAPLLAQSGGLTISTTSLSFASQPAGTTSTLALPVVLTNSSTAIVNISAITPSANFTEADNCGKGLAVGYACTINVSFTPAGTGLVSGTLTITDDASGSPQTINLVGTGVPSPTLNGLTVLHAFSGGTTDTTAPTGVALVQDSAGNFYGATLTGGANGHGAVFELAKTAAGYSETLLYSFTDANGDGDGPNGQLVLDSSGDIYGTTQSGGASTNCSGGCGIVFELINSSGSYSLKVLHTFNGKPDGADPVSGLITDQQGNLYGTTFTGGSYNLGTVYTISRTPLLATPWTLTVLHSFGPSSNENSQNPSGNLVLDPSGNIYGTATLAYSGYSCTLENASCGVLFELVNTSGSYTEKDLASFSSANDWVTLASDGTIYCTESGSYGNGGSIYAVKSGISTLLYSFGGTGDGIYPEGPVVADSNGDVYGATNAGGSQGKGILYELVNTSGRYSESVLYTFTGKADGSNPGNGLMIDTAGDLYGTAGTGGVNGVGTMFKFGSIVAISPLSVDSPPGINYGDVVTGVASTTSVTLTNVGASDLTFGSLAISGTNAADFSLTPDNCSSQTLAPGADCTVGVSFDPPSLGPASGSLSFPAEQSFIPQSVSLSGAGVSAAVISFSPSALTFANTVVGSNASLPVTLTNTGAAPLVISSIVSSGGDFTETNNCPATLAAASFCTISVVYTPSFAGPETGTITVTDDAAGSPQSVNLSGAAIVNLTADQLTILHSFTGVAPDGSIPAAGLLRDAAGNLYGVASNGFGVVYELQYNAGSYTEVILHAFSGPATGGSNADGAVPVGNLIMDSAGDIYGITSVGGSKGDGTVFELVYASGKYTYKTLYSFTGPLGDGANPSGSLVLDAAGDIFGTTSAGGSVSIPGVCASGCGTVFELVNNSGSYTEKIIYDFEKHTGDGYQPQGLTIDNGGNLYGTTAGGGTCTVVGVLGCGNVFELVNSSGSYTGKILYQFTGTQGDGAAPIGNLLIDAGGNIYGLTQGSATPSSGWGIAFELAYSSGSYTKRTLYSFGASAGDAAQPSGGLLMDTSGNLYGVAARGGANGTGAIYDLANSSGTYTENVLYSFPQTSQGGLPATPVGSLVADPVGNLYGVTQSGGPAGFGTAYEFTVHAAVPVVSLSLASVTFGSVPVGTSASSQAVTVTNLGNAPLDFTNIAVSGDFSASANGTCSTSVSLAAEASCVIDIQFTPTKTGSRTGALTLSDNATDSPQSIALSGTGAAPAMTITTAAMAAGAIGVGYSQTLAATGGVAPYTWSLAGGNLPAGLALNAGTGVISGTPSAAGTSTFVAQVTDAEPTPQIATANLSIVIAAEGTPALTIVPTSLTFAAQNTGSTSTAQTVTLTNSGTAGLNITSIAASGDFAQTNNCGTSLAASSNCTVTVTFTPTAGGTRTGSLSIIDNASGSPQTVALTGTGSTVNISSSSTSLSISSAGGTASATIQLSATGGFSGSVNMACSVTYHGTLTAIDSPTCNLNPNQQQVSGTGSVSTTLTVKTTASSSARLENRPLLPFGEGAVAALILFLGVPRRSWRRWSLLGILCIVVTGFSLGCGGGNSSSNSPTNPGTTTGNYDVTVTGTSGTVTASMTIPLTVQ